MSDLKSDHSGNPPNYVLPPGAAAPYAPHAPQAAYGYPPQSPYMGQQVLPGQMGVQQMTTTTTAAVPATPLMGQQQMMQPQMTGNPQMMSMNTSMGMVGQPMQPQPTGVMMNVMMPGMMGGPNYMVLCQQGQHAMTRRYGACGIITAIILFPIGLIFLFVDVEDYCTRCGTRF